MINELNNSENKVIDSDLSDDLNELLNEEDDVDVKILCLTDVKEEEIEWLWFPYVAFGKVTLMHGNPGDGKTFASLKIASQCTRGEALPGNVKLPPINIMYQTAEDGLGDTVKPRLRATNADTDKVFTIDDGGKPITLTDPRLEKAIKTVGAKLLIMDPIQAFVGAGVDINRANEVRAVLTPLCEMAQRNKCAVILIGHLNKARGLVSICRGIGSMDFTATVRSVLIVGRYKDDPSIRIIVHDKSSLAPEGDSIAFRLDGETSSFEWLDGYENVTADDILIASRGSKTHKSTKLDKAVAEIEKLCNEPNKKIHTSTIDDACFALNIHKRTIEEAKKYVVGLDCECRSDGWYYFINPDKLPVYTAEEKKEIENADKFFKDNPSDDYDWTEEYFAPIDDAAGKKEGEENV